MQAQLMPSLNFFFAAFAALSLGAAQDALASKRCELKMPDKSTLILAIDGSEAELQNFSGKRFCRFQASKANAARAAGSKISAESKVRFLASSCKLPARAAFSSLEVTSGKYIPRMATSETSATWVMFGSDYKNHRCGSLK